MSDILREIILRILCTGIICTVALILAGDGVAKEPVRLSCAALVIIMLASPLKSELKKIKTPREYIDSLQSDIDRELENASAAEYRLAADKVKLSIQNRLKNIGAECRFEIDTALEDGQFVIKTVYIKDALSDILKDRVADILASEYGVKRDLIIFEEQQ